MDNPIDYKTALKSYIDAQDPVQEKFMEAVENRKKLEKQKLKEMQSLAGIDMSGQASIKPMAAFADYLNSTVGNRTNLAGSYETPTAPKEQMDQVTALGDYLDRTSGKADSMALQGAQAQSSAAAKLLDLVGKQEDRELNTQYRNAQIDSFQARTKLNEQKASDGPKKENLNGDKWKAAGFAQRMQQAESVINDIMAKHGSEATSYLKGNMRGLIPEGLKPSWMKELEQAEKNFINAQLRRESGAAIGPAEFASGRQQYLPQWGDDPATLENKKQNRLLSFSGMKAESGRAFDEVGKEYSNQSGSSSNGKSRIVRNAQGQQFEIDTDEELKEAMAEGFQLVGE